MSTYFWMNVIFLFVYLLRWNQTSNAIWIHRKFKVSTDFKDLWEIIIFSHFTNKKQQNCRTILIACVLICVHKLQSPHFSMHVIKYSTSEILISYNSFLIHVPLISAGHHSDTHKPTKIPIEVEFSVQWVLACPQICLYVRRATWWLKYTKFWRKKEMTVKHFFKVLWIVFLIFIL